MNLSIENTSDNSPLAVRAGWMLDRGFLSVTELPAAVPVDPHTNDMKRCLTVRLVFGDHDCRVVKIKHLQPNHLGENYRDGAGLLDLCHAPLFGVGFTWVPPADPLKFIGHMVGPGRGVMPRGGRLYSLVRFDDFLLVRRFRREWDCTAWIVAV